jgi:L-threonylcarbamoyladenylate synthase
MTLILNRKDIAKDFITGSQDSVGIRVPRDRIALELLSRFETLGGLGIAAPSANRFGQVSPTSSKDVEEEIGRYLSDNDLILEGGQSEIGIESTIIDCRNENPIILRPGAITAPMIDSVIEVDLQGNQLGEWISLMDCSRNTGIDNGNLSRVCNGKLKHIKGRIFKFK